MIIDLLVAAHGMLSMLFLGDFTGASQNLGMAEDSEYVRIVLTVHNLTTK